MGLSIRASQAICQPPYSKLAAIYDHLMRHVDYGFWADYIESLGDCYGLVERPSILELACGTGNITLHLAQKNYAIVGLDSSPAMLKVAREKAHQRGLAVVFQRGDLRRLRLDQGYDLILCLYDSINYLLERNEVVKAFMAMGQALAPEGLVIFDVCTQSNSLRYFNKRRDLEQKDGCGCERYCYYDARDRIQVNAFTIWLKERGVMRYYQEVHRQRIYTLDEMVGMVTEAGFEILGQLKNFTLEPGGEDADRIHFVLKKRLP